MENKDSDPSFYSIKEFAFKLGVHANTIRRAIKNGRIQAFRVGIGVKSIYRIPYSEINRIALFDLREMIEKMIQERESS